MLLSSNPLTVVVSEEPPPDNWISVSSMSEKTIGTSGTSARPIVIEPRN